MGSSTSRSGGTRCGLVGSDAGPLATSRGYSGFGVDRSRADQGTRAARGERSFGGSRAVRDRSVIRSCPTLGAPGRVRRAGLPLVRRSEEGERRAALRVVTVAVGGRAVAHRTPRCPLSASGCATASPRAPKGLASGREGCAVRRSGVRARRSVGRRAVSICASGPRSRQSRSDARGGLLRGRGRSGVGDGSGVGGRSGRRRVAAPVSRCGAGVVIKPAGDHHTLTADRPGRHRVEGVLITAAEDHHTLSAVLGGPGLRGGVVIKPAGDHHTLTTDRPSQNWSDGVMITPREDHHTLRAELAGGIWSRGVVITSGEDHHTLSTAGAGGMCRGVW